MAFTTGHGGEEGYQDLQVCINFTALNKHCPKDYFPLL
jgi:hypothetical protein